MFHQYSSNSEVETTWIRLICWSYKTSVCPLQHTNFSGKSTSWWQDVPNWGDSTLQQCCLHWLTEWTPVDFRRFLFLPSFSREDFHTKLNLWPILGKLSWKCQKASHPSKPMKFFNGMEMKKYTLFCKINPRQIHCL